jgi:predicted dithiol-disulfide oxidoreductase (DUF899 family)
MELPKIGSREEWPAIRLKLLANEKETLTASPAATCTSQARRNRRATGFGLPSDFRSAGGSNQLAA